MKPEQFIKRYGVDEARQVIAKSPEGTTHIHSVTWQSYKQGEVNNYVWGKSGQDGWYLSIYETLNGMMVLEDLKRLVESLDLVKKLGGVDKCKGYAKVCFFKNRDKYGNRIKQAIRDHEAICGGGDES